MHCVYRQQQLEQERRDRELALRLVAEDQSMVEDVQIVRFYLFYVIVYCIVAVWVIACCTCLYVVPGYSNTMPYKKT